MAGKILQARRHASFFALVVFILILALPGLARADLFTVGGIAVDEKGANAEAARSAAIDKAHELALQKLYQRIVVPEDLAGAPLLPAAEVLALVTSFEINDEKLGKKRYQATLTFQFSAEAVRALLSQRGIRFTETASRPVVVLPVIGEGSTARLWQEPNPWLAAWAGRQQDPEALVPLITPWGELEDVAAADAPEALAGDRSALAALAGRYGASDALVVQALVTGDPEAGGASLAVIAIRYGTASDGKSNRLDLTQEAGESAAAFFVRAAEVVAQRVNDEWKRGNAIYYGTESKIDVAVAIAGLQDWLVVQKTLQSLPIVSSVTVKSMSQTLAQITIGHRGTTAQLASALAQYDLLLSQGVVGWELRVATASGSTLQPKPLDQPPAQTPPVVPTP